MTKAEEKALAAYPDKEMNGIVMLFHEQRRLFQEGYEKAQKDLSLTIEDIENIHTFFYAVKNNKHGVFTFTRLSDEQYKEVLRRFKAIKEE